MSPMIDKFCGRCIPFFTAAICILFCAQNAVADVVAQWHFDEAGGMVAEDSVGSIDGVLAGDASFVGGGISGNAVSMTIGGGGLVNMGDNFGFTTGDFSIVSWVQLAMGDATPGYFIAGKHRSTQVAGYFLNINSTGGYGAVDKAFFYESNPSGGLNPSSSTSINDGNWHQVVGVYNAGGLAEIFVDGNLEDSAAAHTIGGITQSFLIGGISDSGGTPFGSLNGMVDEVQLYDHALTTGEVQFLFDNPSSVAGVPEPATGAILALSLCTVLMRRRR